MLFISLLCRSEIKKLTEGHVNFINTVTGKIHKTLHDKISNLLVEDPQISTAATLDIMLKTPFSTDRPHITLSFQRTLQMLI